MQYSEIKKIFAHEYEKNSKIDILLNILYPRVFAYVSPKYKYCTYGVSCEDVVQQCMIKIYLFLDKSSSSFTSHHIARLTGDEVYLYTQTIVKQTLKNAFQISRLTSIKDGNAVESGACSSEVVPHVDFILADLKTHYTQVFKNEPLFFIEGLNGRQDFIDVISKLGVLKAKKLFMNYMGYTTANTASYRKFRKWFDVRIHRVKGYLLQSTVKFRPYFGCTVF